MDKPQRRKRLSFPKTGDTPESKKTVNKAGHQCKLEQQYIQAEVRRDVQFEEGRYVDKEDLVQYFGRPFKQLEYALRQVFPSAKCVKGTYYDLTLKSEAISTRTNDANIAEERALCTTIRIPTLYKLLNETIPGDSRPGSNKEPAILTTICKLLNIRSPKLNAMAKINGLLLRKSGVPKSTTNIMSRLYDTVSYGTTTSLLNKYAENVNSILQTWTDLGITQVGDNVNVRSSRRHEKQGQSTYDLHMYNNLILKPRLDYGQYDSCKPDVPTKWTTDHMSQLLPYNNDQLMQYLRPIVANSWSKEDPKYKDYAGNGRHSLSTEMSKPSEVIQLGVIEKSESKTEDMIDILKFAKRHPTHDYSETMVYYGDYKTYEMAMAMSNAGAGALCGLLPAISDFHLQMEWTQLTFDRLYSSGSITDVGTLYHLKTLLGSQQVKKDIRQNYYAAKHFLDKVRDTYLKIAYDQYNGPECTGTPLERIDGLLRTIFTLVLKPLLGSTCQYFAKEYKDAVKLREHLCKMHGVTLSAQVRTGEDEVCQHTLLLLKLLLLKENLEVSIKVADGERLLCTVKHMLPYFRQLNCPKYALASLELNAMCKYFLSERMAMEVKQGRFANQRGKFDSNYPVDLYCEHSNREFKDHFSLYRGQPTECAIDRISKSLYMTTKIIDNFCEQFDKPRYVSERRINQIEYDADVKMMYDFLSPYDIVKHTGRNYKNSAISKNCSDPLLNLDHAKLQNWMRHRLNEMRTQPWLC